MLDKCPYVKHIIVIEDQLVREGNNELQGAVEVLSFYDVVNFEKPAHGHQIHLTWLSYCTQVDQLECQKV